MTIPWNNPVVSTISHCAIVLACMIIGWIFKDAYGGWLFGVGLLWGREAVQTYYTWRHGGWPRENVKVEILCLLGIRWDWRNWFDVAIPAMMVYFIVNYFFNNN